MSLSHQIPGTTPSSQDMPVSLCQEKAKVSDQNPFKKCYINFKAGTTMNDFI